MTDAIWNTRFETGIDLIDAQHKALFKAVNKLAAAFQADDMDREIKESLHFLLDYTVDHFQAEEQFMRDMAFPGLADHMAEHARLLDRVLVLQARLAQGGTVTRDVTTLYAGWLKHHICGTDMAYVRFLKEKERVG